ncbi:MAG: hypothetical protein AAF799_31775 [Myxococcota bacterium]
MSDLRIAEATVDHAFGHAPGLVLYVWRGVVQPSTVQRLIAMAPKARNGADGSAVGMLGIVTDDAPPPSAESRRALADMLVQVDFLSASALTFESGGFQGAMVRAVATGLNLLARPPFPHKVFPTVFAATHWLQRELATVDAQTREARGCEALLQELRAAPHQ